VTLPLGGIRAVTFDFGNTLVPVGRDGLRRVVEITADQVARAVTGVDASEFLLAWAEERDRQFRENVPQFREVDIAERIIRVFARLRGAAAPVDEPWDQPAAALLSEPAEVELAMQSYSHAFVEGMPPHPGVGSLFRSLVAEGRRLAILSNWPLAATIDSYAEANGWCNELDAVVVSERVGVIKPHAAIFAAARAALGDPDPAAILHVGDDWAGDVVGASSAGWRTGWLPGRPEDSPLPTSTRAGDLQPDLVLDRLDDLLPLLAPLPAA
jgi:FMN phosphatase YigB (HAD superfamily)